MAVKLGRSAALPMVLMAVAVALGGCSGSSGAASSGDGGVIDRPPPGDAPPPADDPGSQPDGEPAVTLSAADAVVGSGQTTTLTWRSEHVTSCSASGGWSGSQPLSGSATVGPITASTTFTLSCTGDAGSAMAMISVATIGVVTVSWQPPTENVDGSPLVDLDGYRIYLGTTSRQYTDEVTVNDPGRTSQSLELSSGDYYIAMTAVDAAGNESSYSNEIVRTVN